MPVSGRRLIDWQTQPLRTVLFAPGDDERKLAKVARFGADAVVFDLEDAVAEANKDVARARVRTALANRTAVEPVLVRVNSADSGRLIEDVRTVVHPSLDGIIVPKVESVETVSAIGALLDSIETDSGMAAGSIALFPSIETALGLIHCEEIALSAPGRIVTLVFGVGDFARDVRLELTADGHELLYARSRIVAAARAGRLGAPIDGPYFGLRDTAGLVSDSERSRRFGFQGRVIVYPPQVEHVRRAYSFLSPKELQLYRRIVAAFTEAEAAGSAAIVVDGIFVDYAVFEDAARKLRRHEALEEQEHDS